MATYFNDCSSLTGWTERALDAGTNFSVSSGAFVTTGGNIEFLTLDSIDAERQDIELLVKIKIAAFSGTNYVSIGRGAGTAGSNYSGYIVALRSTAIRTYYKTTAGSLTQIASTTISTLSTDTYYWVRLRVNSTTIRARYWADGGSEGGTWDCDNTDANVSGDGYAGFVQGAVATTVTRDSFGAGTNGDTAPASEPSTAASIAFPRAFPRAILNL